MMRLNSMHTCFTDHPRIPMSTARPIFRQRLLQLSAIAAWPLLFAAAPTLAQNDSGGPGGHGACDQGMRGPPPRPPGPPMGPGFGRFGFDGDEARPPPFLRDVSLSETQQDQVFAIVHAAAPTLREQSKAVTKSRDALRELVGSAQFSDAAAKALADAQGKAETQLALTRVRMEHEVYAVLTPQQQTEVAKRRQEWQSRVGPGPGPRPGAGPGPCAGPGAVH
jgi:protein CpxP